MKERIGRIFTKVDCAFSEFPKLKYLSLFYVLLTVFVAISYEPILAWAYEFNHLGRFPLQNFIGENAHWLLWGEFVAPVVLAIIFYCDVSDRHDEKYLKKYRQLPKWI